MVQVLWFDYENDLEYFFNKQLNLISDTAKHTFEVYKKQSKQEYKKNLWDIRNFYATFVQWNWAIKKATNDLMWEKIISVIISAWKHLHIPKLWGKEDVIVFVLKQDWVNVYKSSFKHLSPASIVWAVDYLLIAPKRELKNVKTWSFSIEGFLSRLSYNSTEIKNGVSVKINLDWDELECKDIYQPLLHLFLYFAKNWGKENLSEKELQKIFLDKYMLDMKSKPAIPEENNEGNKKVLDEKKWGVIKSKVVVDNWKKYDEYWFDDEWYNREWFDAYWYDREWYNRKWYNKKWFDRLWFDKDWYNKLWLDENGYDREWYDKGWYDENWYDKEWYNRDWYNDAWYDRKWFDRKGYNEEWLDKNGYDEEWYKNWFNKQWYDRDWYNKEWYNKKWFDRRWINKVTWTIYDKKWYDMNWFNKQWIYIKTWTKFDDEWYDVDWFNEEWYSRNWARNIATGLFLLILIIIIIIVLGISMS